MFDDYVFLPRYNPHVASPYLPSIPHMTPIMDYSSPHLSHSTSSVLLLRLAVGALGKSWRGEEGASYAGAASTFISAAWAANG